MNRQTTHEWEGRLEILDTLPERLQLGSEMAVVELVDRINQELRRAKDSINRRGLAASIEVVTNRFTSFAASELTNGVVLVRNLKNDLGDLRIWLAGTNETASRLHTTATHALSSTSQLGGVVGTVNHGASRLGTSIGAANSDTPSAPISTTPNLVSMMQTPALQISLWNSYRLVILYRVVAIVCRVFFWLTHITRRLAIRLLGSGVRYGGTAVDFPMDPPVTDGVMSSSFR
ncbi:hypothetical protein FRB97_007773 [Tulasnella sp. 331]|nr:hypothetical protein FRB97_007773 [Tulasnella sp. 331]